MSRSRTKALLEAEEKRKQMMVIAAASVAVLFFIFVVIRSCGGPGATTGVTDVAPAGTKSGRQAEIDSLKGQR